MFSLHALPVHVQPCLSLLFLLFMSMPVLDELGETRVAQQG